MHHRPARRRHRRVGVTAVNVAAVNVAVVVALLATAGCGRGDNSDNAANKRPSDGSTASAPAGTGLIDRARCKDTTTGVTNSQITFGMSHPESGPSAITAKIGDGVKAYFDYVNAEKGGAKGHQLKLVTKDDAAQPARTVTNVNELVEKDKVFGFVQNLGTPNNLAIWDRLDQQCVPNLLVGNGAPALVDPKGHPFTLIANAAYASEVAAFVAYLEEHKPDAKIALIYENSDFGKSYRDPLVKAVQGTSLKLVAQQTYEPSDPNVSSQFTAIGASGADALFIGAVALKCPQSMDAAAGKGFDVVYLSANCTSKSIISLAKPQNSNGVLSESASMEPTNPKWADNPRMKTYWEKVKQYAPSADPTNSLIAYGWTSAAVLVAILDASPELDRVSVMETARSVDLTPLPGLFLDGVKWKTDGAADPYPVESFGLRKWDSKAGHFEPLGDISSFEGRTQEFVG